MEPGLVSEFYSKDAAMNERKKILVIDDEVDFSEMVKMNLEEIGPYDVSIENNGSRGYLAALECKPQFILLDVVMKDMDGRDVLKQIKSDPETHDIPVVFLTALSLEKSLLGDLKKHEHCQVLSKPVTLNELVHCIEKTIP